MLVTSTLPFRRSKRKGNSSHSVVCGRKSSSCRNRDTLRQGPAGRRRRSSRTPGRGSSCGSARFRRGSARAAPGRGPRCGSRESSASMSTSPTAVRTQRCWGSPLIQLARDTISKPICGPLDRVGRVARRVEAQLCSGRAIWRRVAHVSWRSSANCGKREKSVSSGRRLRTRRQSWSSARSARRASCGCCASRVRTAALVRGARLRVRLRLLLLGFLLPADVLLLLLQPCAVLSLLVPSFPAVPSFCAVPLLPVALLVPAVPVRAGELLACLPVRLP